MISGKLKLKICIFGPFFMSLTFEVPYLNGNCLNFKGSRNSICPPLLEIQLSMGCILGKEVA